MNYPSKIICLTEESVETLYLLGREDLIVGVSEYVERPAEAKQLPRVSQFIRSDIQQIKGLNPDLIIGFSDIQKDIARDLIAEGLNVYVSNQRSLDEILAQILFLGRIIGEEKKAIKLVENFRSKMQETVEKSRKLPMVPQIYFEEWDHPRLSAIRWVTELIEVCGGKSIFSELTGGLAKERQVSDEDIVHRNPDVILGCWCGKKVKTDSFARRKGYDQVTAIQKDFVWELDPAIYLQPGPALFVSGLDQLSALLERVSLDLSQNKPII